MGHPGGVWPPRFGRGGCAFSPQRPKLQQYDDSLFRDIYDHLVRINEAVDSLRELVTAALEANLSLISVSQNEDTKRLAAWAAIITVPTMIAGIYGMNFDYIPELNLHYGYLITLAAMALACAGLYVGFRRSKWL